MNREDLDFYKGKNVLITGHTGFKGSWLCRILVNAGANVTGYSLEPPTDPALQQQPEALTWHTAWR
jgi:CDP-glucose 4,6-dehydratase